MFIARFWLPRKFCISSNNTNNDFSAIYCYARCYIFLSVLFIVIQNLPHVAKMRNRQNSHRNTQRHGISFIYYCSLLAELFLFIISSSNHNDKFLDNKIKIRFHYTVFLLSYSINRETFYWKNLLFVFNIACKCPLLLLIMEYKWNSN